MNYIIQPRPDLMDQKYLQQQKEEAEKLMPQVKDLCLAHGMPPEVWSLVRDPSVVARALLNTGYLPTFLPLNTEFDKTPIPKAEIKRLHPASVRMVEHAMQFIMVPHYCFTANEDWWHGKKHFIVTTLSAAVESQRYRRCLQFANERTWEPEVKRGAGRPANPNKIVSQPEKWDKWLSYCLERRKKLEMLDEKMKTIRGESEQQIKQIKIEIEEINLTAIKSFGLFKELTND